MLDSLIKTQKVGRCFTVLLALSNSFYKYLSITPSRHIITSQSSITLLSSQAYHRSPLFTSYRENFSLLSLELLLARHFQCSDTPSPRVVQERSPTGMQGSPIGMQGSPPDVRLGPKDVVSLVTKRSTAHLTLLQIAPL
jgi:hypothetical protein